MAFDNATHGEDLWDAAEHIKSQLEDNLIGWVEKDGKVIAYSDYFWLKDYEDVYIYEQTGVSPNGEPGGILYINNCVIKSDDKRIIWELLKKRPRSEFICWKRRNDEERLKIWRTHYGKNKAKQEAA